MELPCIEPAREFRASVADDTEWLDENGQPFRSEYRGDAGIRQHQLDKARIVRFQRVVYTAIVVLVLIPVAFYIAHLGGLVAMQGPYNFAAINFTFPGFDAAGRLILDMDTLCATLVAAAAAILAFTPGPNLNEV